MHAWYADERAFIHPEVRMCLPAEDLRFRRDGARELRRVECELPAVEVERDLPAYGGVIVGLRLGQLMERHDLPLAPPTRSACAVGLKNGRSITYAVASLRNGKTLRVPSLGPVFDSESQP